MTGPCLRRAALGLGAGLWLAGAALADACPDPVMGLTMDDGSVKTVQARTDDTVTILMESPIYTARTTQHLGLIPLVTEGPDGPITHDWATPLPGLKALVPGATFRLEGTAQSATGKVAVVMDLTVQAEVALTVGDCVLTVQKIDSTITEDTEAWPTFTLFLHKPSLLILQSEALVNSGAPLRSWAVALQ